MCLEQDCTAVIMLTNVMERGITKCASYFPAKEGDVVGSSSLEVKNLHTSKQGEITVRKIQISSSVNGSLKTSALTHFHYTTWPDHGAPKDSQAIRTMCNALPPLRRQGETVAVHCSAGIGRTGTFMAIDITRCKLQRLNEKDAIGEEVSTTTLHEALAIPDLVHELRMQRMGMVQTLEQYEFIYQALKEELLELVSAPAVSPDDQGDGFVRSL
ncbi:hypothetical protein CEUSTIGMA_g9312.t1 [Chlamydomonas eustigma]|uniref:Protein-tyrosine-phosphatase n=1 Tax=Chlamydomonas eustigma TaxID=1157962 RepID=A0A250XFM8_9CHLO|nr:hypothetical protein CEUSTIGMA_g9312.t1 [Chlamydomonas eustigma]|eukprot:GAX81884.1 hypothetical protein CEUSTIGMA_g9312.t1 [Chlamydomonas eustigma]